MLEIADDSKINWPRCIVTLFDLIGIQGLADSGRGSEMMIKMHSFAVERIDSGLPLHAIGYIWNDSILLVSNVTGSPADRERLCVELSDFKASLEDACGLSAYAISVMGRSFPQGRESNLNQGSCVTQRRAIVMKASSWALANCFIIEKRLKRNRADWYIDSRITAGLKYLKPFKSERVPLLPKEQRRTIHMLMGSLSRPAQAAI